MIGQILPDIKNLICTTCGENFCWSRPHDSGSELCNQYKAKQNALEKYGKEVDGWLFTADGMRGMR